MHAWLDQKWSELTKPYSAETALVTKHLREIKRKYDASSRHYHTLTHIQQMLQLSDRYAGHLQSKEIVDFSVIYHDIIYNVWRKDNEDRSAAIAVKRLIELGVPDDKTGLIHSFIEATHSHSIPQGFVAPDDLAFFLDFDMAILGADWPEYLEYTTQVRKEYHIYPDMLYKAGRRKFLQNCLRSPHVFQTSIFRDQFEPKARTNMEKELQLL